MLKSDLCLFAAQIIVQAAWHTCQVSFFHSFGMFIFGEAHSYPW